MSSNQRGRGPSVRSSTYPTNLIDGAPRSLSRGIFTPAKPTRLRGQVPLRDLFLFSCSLPRAALLLRVSRRTWLAGSLGCATVRHGWHHADTSHHQELIDHKKPPTRQTQQGRLGTPTLFFILFWASKSMASLPDVTSLQYPAS